MSVTRQESVYKGCRIVTFTPETPHGTMVWFHGGGWMIELGDDALAWGHDLAASTQLVVHMPDYPLAREFAYPKSNAWCSDYWRHINQTTPGKCYLGGDSAGAHLALCTLPAARPTKALFIYAVTTLLPIRNAGSWAAYQKKGWTLSPRLMDYFYDAYCPNHADRLGASPLEQLESIPPTLLITAANDILADQQTDFAHRFGAQQIIYDGASHIFLSREDGILYRQRALQDATRWLCDA
jgi:acetyl esterase